MSSFSSQKINNSSLMPKYLCDEFVQLEGGTPDWVKTLIMAEVRVLTATKEGTFAAMTKVLDHYSEMGVNSIWLTPIHDPGPKGNGYSNYGPHTIDPQMTGTDDYEEGWKIFKNFVDSAHSKNIRIILDVISWGTVKDSQLFIDNPQWYGDEKRYGGDGFDWKNEEFKEWYIQTLVDIALETGIDGYRYDVEPLFAGEKVGKEIRDRLYAAGRKMVMISELMSERNDTYDFEQCGIREAFENQYHLNPLMTFVDKYSIVDSIKRGKNIGLKKLEEEGNGGNYRFYTHCLSTHDFFYYTLRNRKLAIGYQAIFAPFIPIWYIGDEWNNERQTPLPGNVLYFNKIDWELMNTPENREFFEEIKKMINIRLSNPEIFNYYPENHRESNICDVNVQGIEFLRAYARYKDNKAIIVVPNYNNYNKNSDFKIHFPFKEMGLSEYDEYLIVDAFSDELIVQGDEEAVQDLQINVPWADMKVIKIIAK